MHTARTEVAAPPRLVPPAPPEPVDETTLRAELDELNLSLRALRSTDFAVRAYFELWLAFLAGSVGAKMLYDWHITNAKPPTVVGPLLFLCTVLVVDSIVQRVRQFRMQREEEVRIRRQRELRERLGLNDAPVPVMDDLPQAAVA